MTRDAHIVDVEFSHAGGMCTTYQPGPIRWRRDVLERVPVRFFTDRSLEYVRDFKQDQAVALLVEPRIGANARFYDAAERLPFDRILSYDRSFVERQPAFRGLLYRFGGTWLRPDEYWAGPGLEDKHHQVSIITSPKRDSIGQRLRHEVAEEFPGIDRFGSDFRYVESKATALRPFAFSVVIENSQIDDYFSEKLIDCLLCGTIPIYWGSPAVAKTFDDAGLITFDSLDELRGIIWTLRMGEWRAKQDIVRENQRRAMRFVSPELELFERYPFLFPE